MKLYYIRSAHVLEYASRGDGTSLRLAPNSVWQLASSEHGYQRTSSYRLLSASKIPQSLNTGDKGDAVVLGTVYRPSSVLGPAETSH